MTSHLEVGEVSSTNRRLQPEESGSACRHVPKQPLLDPLSVRELEVLRLLAQGATNQEIARELIVTLETVKRHVSNILSKLGTSNRTQAAARAHARGLLVG